MFPDNVLILLHHWSLLFLYKKYVYKFFFKKKATSNQEFISFLTCIQIHQNSKLKKKTAVYWDKRRRLLKPKIASYKTKISSHKTKITSYKKNQFAKDKDHFLEKKKSISHKTKITSFKKKSIRTRHWPLPQKKSIRTR